MSCHQKINLYKVKINHHTIFSGPKKAARKIFNKWKNLYNNITVRLLNWYGELIRERPSNEKVSFLKTIKDFYNVSRAERKVKWVQKKMFLEQILNEISGRTEMLRSRIEL